MADIAGEAAIEPIGKVLKDDNNDLVRHEAAFSLGQLGFSSGIKPLADAVKNDASLFVRHEAAVALGVIGSEEARKILNDALEAFRLQTAWMREDHAAWRPRRDRVQFFTTIEDAERAGFRACRRCRRSGLG